MSVQHHEFAADLKYKGNVVELSGTIREVKSGNRGRYYLGFQIVVGGGLPQAQFDALPPKERKWHSEGFPPNAVCFIARGEETSLAAIKPGQQVAVIGKVVGRKSADVFQGYTVVVDDSRIPPKKD